MKFPAKQLSEFTAVPAGNHVAICNAVIDLGMQPGSPMYPDPKRQVYLRFELPTERTEYKKDGETIEGPMSIGTSMTASMNEKATLRKLIESWFGKKFPNDDTAADFDVQKLLGRKCLLNVAHKDKNGKTYANIVTATPIPKGMPADYPQHNPSLFYSLDDPGTFPAYALLPEWLKKKIDARLDAVAQPVRREAELVGAGADFDDDIGF
jgi:hypothetical protein